jgi:hypothetical protein
MQWIIKKEERTIKEENKKVTVTVKQETEGKLSDLTDIFCDQMIRFKIHVFNIWNQLTFYRKPRKELKEKEGMIHIDFAENFQTQLRQEVQSMHYGASHSQVTLHTGVSLNGKRFCCENF